MKKNTRSPDNIDILGEKWLLAPYGSDIVDSAKEHLFDIQAELMGYSTLFRNLGTDFVLDQEGLYGIGITLGRLSKRISRISDRLARVVIREFESQSSAGSVRNPPSKSSA